MTAPVRPIPADPGEAGFDRALASAARSLVLEPLPVDVFAVPPPITTRTWLRAAVPVAAVVGIMVLAIGSVIGAPRPVETDPAPAFQTGDQVTQAFRSIGFSCHPGAAAEPGEARMEAVVCTDTGPYQVLTVVVSEDATGRVGEIHIASDTLGRSTAAAERDRANRLAAMIGQPFADPGAAAAARTWLIGAMPLDPGERIRTTVASVPVVLDRGTGGYSLVLGDLGDLGAGPGTLPSR